MFLRSTSGSRPRSSWQVVLDLIDRSTNKASSLALSSSLRTVGVGNSYPRLYPSNGILARLSASYATRMLIVRISACNDSACLIQGVPASLLEAKFALLESPEIRYSGETKAEPHIRRSACTPSR